MTSRPLDSDEARAELYRIMQQDLSFEEKAQEALELGEAYLDVQNAHLTQIDQAIDYREAIVSTDPPDGDFPAGAVFDLQETYCRRVIERGATVAFSNASKEGWADDPAYRKHQLDCYHGTPLSIDGNVFGTLCFVSEQPRKPFSESETLFAELIARLLEREIAQTRQEIELEQRANLISVLSRVLRHNLRNDLNVIRGHIARLNQNTEGSFLDDAVAVNKIDKLIKLANTARKIESISSSNLDSQPVELNALVEHVISRVRSSYPSASFAVEAPEEVYVEAIPTLLTALEEVITNAAKHAGEHPEVTVTIEPNADAIDIHVTDDGPGLPEQEQQVLQAGAESPLIHGSGLGLWLTHWIVQNHDGTISTEVTEAGTRITLSVPKTSNLTEFAETETLLGKFHREEDRFEAVFEQSFDAILIIDDEGRYTDVNQQAAELFGVPQEELRGRSITEFVPDRFDVQEAWETFKSAETDRSTFPLLRADGTERIIEYSGVTDIVPGQHLAILRDITDRIEREAALEETTQQLEAVIEASPDPIMLLDEDAEIQLWNQAAERVFGYAADEVIGETLLSLDIYDKTETSTFEERFQRALAGESFVDFEVERATKDGETVQLSISTAPVRDADGDINGIVAIARDITDRITTERRYEALSEGFPDICFIIDEDCRHRDILASPASREGLYADPETILGTAIDELLPAPQGEVALEKIREAVETGERQTYRYELELAGGTRTFEARVHPLNETVEDKRLVSLVTRDITDLPGGDTVPETVGD